jgi:hypothetical protein
MVGLHDSDPAGGVPDRVGAMIARFDGFHEEPLLTSRVACQPGSAVAAGIVGRAVVAAVPAMVFR